MYLYSFDWTKFSGRHVKIKSESLTLSIPSTTTPKLPNDLNFIQATSHTCDQNKEMGLQISCTGATCFAAGFSRCERLMFAGGPGRKGAVPIARVVGLFRRASTVVFGVILLL